MKDLLSEMMNTIPDPGELCIWWLGQEGYVIKNNNLTIYIDPYLSTYAERITRGKPNEHVRMTPAPIRPEEVKNADIVLCTHDHADHIDPDSIPVITQKSPQARFIVPECAMQTMLGFDISPERIITLKGDDSVNINGITVYAIPAKHEQFNKDDKNGFSFLSYIIEFDNMKLLHVGDSIPYEGQVEKMLKHKLDLVFVPINGRDEFRHKLEFEGNFTCKEAVDFAIAIKAGLTIPMHYDMFTLNTADVNEFINIAKENKLKYHITQPAQLFCFPMEKKR